MRPTFPIAFARSLVIFLDWEVQESQCWVSDIELVFVLAATGLSFAIETPTEGPLLKPFFEFFAKPPLPTRFVKPLVLTLDQASGGSIADWCPRRIGYRSQTRSSTLHQEAADTICASARVLSREGPWMRSLHTAQAV